MDDQNANDRAFSEAWINYPHRILGRPLDPFCLDHLLALTLINSPFVAGGAESVGWADVFKAIAICRTPFESPIRFPSPWRARARIRWEAFKRRTTNGKAGLTLADAAVAFRSYQNDYHATPELFFTDDGRVLTAPAILARAVYLQRICGMEERRIWRMPIGKMMWIYAAALEQETDSVSLIKGEEADFLTIVGKKQRGEELTEAEERLFGEFTADFNEAELTGSAGSN